ncbi:MAG TPA: hypothetical protein VGB30_12345 [bacterium]
MGNLTQSREDAKRILYKHLPAVWKSNESLNIPTNALSGNPPRRTLRPYCPHTSSAYASIVYATEGVGNREKTVPL